MWKISDAICLLILGIAGFIDIRKREIPIYIVWCSGILSVIYHIVKGKVDIWILAGGILVGGVFLIISKFTEEGFGYGDSLMILVLGSFLGLWNVLVVITMSFFVMLCVVIPMLWKKKMSRTCTLPFLPFLAGGYLCFLMMGGTGS